MKNFILLVFVSNLEFGDMYFPSINRTDVDLKGDFGRLFLFTSAYCRLLAWAMT